MGGRRPRVTTTVSGHIQDGEETGSSSYRGSRRWRSGSDAPVCASGLTEDDELSAGQTVRKGPSSRPTDCDATAKNLAAPSEARWVATRPQVMWRTKRAGDTRGHGGRPSERAPSHPELGPVDSGFGTQGTDTL